jgi:hypothetical protein
MFAIYTSVRVIDVNTFCYMTKLRKGESSFKISLPSVFCVIASLGDDLIVRNFQRMFVQAEA